MRLLLLLAAIAVLLAPTAAAACDPKTPAGLAACVDQSRYAADMKRLASRPRGGGSEGLNDARYLCMSTFALANAEPTNHVAFKEPFISNVIGRQRGTDPTRKPVLVGAHIDSLPNCIGANDNASGAAGVLEMARVFAQTKHAADIYFACWDGEERGLVGSTAWVRENQAIQFDATITFEQIGNRLREPNTQLPPPPDWFTPLFPEAARQMHEGELRADFAMFFWDDRTPMHVWDAMQKAAGIRLLKGEVPRPGNGMMSSVHPMLTRSDHLSFWELNQPAIYITDTGPFRKSGYHCDGRPDDLAHIDMAFAAAIVRASTVFIADQAGLVP